MFTSVPLHIHTVSTTMLHFACSSCTVKVCAPVWSSRGPAGVRTTWSPSLLQSEDKNCVFINIIFTAHLVCKYKKGQTLKNIFYCNSFPGCLVIEANTRQPDVPQDGIVFRKLRNFPFCFLRQVLLQFILVKHQLLPWLSYHSHAQLVLQTHDWSWSQILQGEKAGGGGTAGLSYESKCFCSYEQILIVGVSQCCGCEKFGHELP